MRFDFVDIKKKDYEFNNSLNRWFGTEGLDFELKNVEYKIEYFAELFITSYGIDGMIAVIKNVVLTCDIEVDVEEATNEQLQLLENGGLEQIGTNLYGNFGFTFKTDKNIIQEDSINRYREISVNDVNLLIEKDKEVWFEVN